LSDQFSVKNEEKKKKRKRKRVIHRLRRLNADYLRGIFKRKRWRWY